MRIKLSIVMDPISTINYKKDSSLAMLLAAEKKGWQLFYMEQSDLYQLGGEAFGSMRPLSVSVGPSDWFRLGDREEMALAELNVILMRKDPPFDMEYIYSTYILEQAEAEGTIVVNKPRSIRDCNEKYFATRFPKCTPPTLVSRSSRLIREFVLDNQDVVFKPLDGMGGASIFRTQQNDPNLSVIIETLTNYGQRQAMVQKFIPEIKAGDKRILMIDGKPVPYALARVPSEGELRGNLAAGGKGIGQDLSDQDYRIAKQVGPVLKEKGLLFVGLDVIGDYLTEINVTSPTCIRELDNQFDISIGDMLMDKIEEKLAAQC
ncbi:MAG: glutathione synthase [Candidatus Endonucleobacter bathymodioli]|uniref:Glutathione synthetase n=1 Tax=Candidatus Endonucleibacter bathymodioli TaxID=539814 RepID=A0AA90NTQ6_9GAMM|nr:glutathione synthase [Candidatus Endonucleobacter bathymodioli]